MKRFVVVGVLLFAGANVAESQEKASISEAKAAKALLRLECAREVLKLRAENRFNSMFEVTPDQTKPRVSFVALELEFEQEIIEIAKREKQKTDADRDYQHIPPASWILAAIHRLNSHGVIAQLYGPNPLSIIRNRPFTRYEIAVSLARSAHKFLQLNEKPKWFSIPEVRQDLQLLCAEFDNDLWQLGVNDFFNLDSRKQLASPPHTFIPAQKLVPSGVGDYLRK